MALQILNEITDTLTEAVFCFTGKSPKPRTEMTAIAINAGASVTKSITRRTTILVIADPSSKSSKAEKARDTGMHMISPEQFFEMCSSRITKYKSGISVSEISIKKLATINAKGRHSLTRRIEL